MIPKIYKILLVWSNSNKLVVTVTCLQSPVCLKQLAFDLLELLLLSALPELDYVFKQLHEEKHKFGDFKS